MFTWLLRLVERLSGGGATANPTFRSADPGYGRETVGRAYPLVPLTRYEGTERPPRLHWKPSHASTIRRFKAEVTCSHGHGITLLNHAVEADGRIVPSIVCRTPGCDFHEIARLKDWTFGAIPPYAGGLGPRGSRGD